VNVGDRVTRMIAGVIPQELAVTEIKEDRFVCGAWEFDLKTGAEIDDDLGWGPPTPEEPGKMTGSFIKLPGIKYEVKQ
jgi:hypothetical protein